MTIYINRLFHHLATYQKWPTLKPLLGLYARPFVGIILETPRAGFEPATSRLTVDRSTAELPRIIGDVFSPLLSYHWGNQFDK
jgi:hypothetical protein